MEGRIDPPSSIARMDVDAIARQSETGEIWVIGSPAIACIFLTPRDGALYLGKIAVASGHRNRGHARRLIAVAEDRARALGLGALELQSRVELIENHAAFAALGFRQIELTAHEGYAQPTSITFRKILDR